MGEETQTIFTPSVKVFDIREVDVNGFRYFCEVDENANVM